MGIAFKSAGPMFPAGVLVLLALQIVAVVLNTHYPCFQAYANPWVLWLTHWDGLPAGSAFYMIIPGVQTVAFVMWVANEFLFWPYIIRWFIELLVQRQDWPGGDKRGMFVCANAMWVLGLKQPTFVWTVLGRWFGSPWPVI